MRYKVKFIISYCSYFLQRMFTHIHDTEKALNVRHNRELVDLHSCSHHNFRAISLPLPQLPFFEMEQIILLGTETGMQKWIRHLDAMVMRTI